MRIRSINRRAHSAKLWTTLLAFLLAALPIAGLRAEPGKDKSNVKLPLPTDMLLALINADIAASNPNARQVGPIASSSPDSGTCGNDWATETFDRYFQIKSNNDGTYSVYESFKNGVFTTLEGPSPGACDSTDGTPPGFLNAGIMGKMHGYLLTNVACDPVLGCPANPTCGVNGSACQTTQGFIDTFFGLGASRSDQAWFFHYVGNDGNNKLLVEHEWKNASENRGGNHGDIASCHTVTTASTSGLVVPLSLIPPPVGCP